MIDFRTLLFTAAALAAGAPAQEPVPQAKAPAAEAPHKEAPKAAEAWIEKLGSESYRTRLEAERALRAMGEAAVPALQKAAEASGDAEVQWRARRVLRQIERGGAGDLVQRERAGQPPADAKAEQEPQPPRGQRPGAERDPMRDQFESLFERFEREFGVDIPRARFFDDSFFRDLQEQMKAGASRSQGLSMQIGPDGSVRVEVREQGPDGKSETKVYEAPDMESFQQKFPGVLRRNGLGMGLLPGEMQLRGFGGQPLRGWLFEGNGLAPRTRALPGEPGLQPRNVEPLAEPPMAAPPVGKRLGITVRNDLSPALRDHLGLAEGVGLMVEDVQADSLAAALGLQKGDIVVRIGERPIGSPQDVQEALGALHKGDEVVVHFLRKGTEKQATARKSEDVAPEAAPKLEKRDRSGGQIR